MTVPVTVEKEVTRYCRGGRQASEGLSASVGNSGGRTVFLSDEVLGNVEVTMATSIVKWCIAIHCSHMMDYSVPL